MNLFLLLFYWINHGRERAKAVVRFPAVVRNGSYGGRFFLSEIATHRSEGSHFKFVSKTIRVFWPAFCSVVILQTLPSVFWHAH